MVNNQNYCSDTLHDFNRTKNLTPLTKGSTKQYQDTIKKELLHCKIVFTETVKQTLIKFTNLANFVNKEL